MKIKATVGNSKLLHQAPGILYNRFCSWMIKAQEDKIIAFHSISDFEFEISGIDLLEIYDSSDCYLTKSKTFSKSLILLEDDFGCYKLASSDSELYRSINKTKRRNLNIGDVILTNLNLNSNIPFVFLGTYIEYFNGKQSRVIFLKNTTNDRVINTREECLISAHVLDHIDISDEDLKDMIKYTYNGETYKLKEVGESTSDIMFYVKAPF